ncbi:probable cytochrome P450 313a4 [Onthophagus taurus]|uniref:probable cytochrome P450 313a4 n=1 Tax=Onthophagus taurus TaxID=166361 RepID=UPI0039BE0901
MFPTPTQLPLLGITYKARNTVGIYNALQSYIKEMGKNIFAMMGPFPTLITSDPKIFSAVLGSSKRINKPFVFSVAFNMMAPNSLIVVNGDEWRRQRKLLNPSLDYKNVMDNNKIFNKHSENLINKLKEEINNESVEVRHILEDFTLEQSVETLLGDTEFEFDKKVIGKCINSLMNIAAKKCISPLSYFSITQIFTKIYWQERNLLKIVHKSLKKFIEKTRKEFNSGVKIERRPIYIDILMSTNFTDAFIEDQITVGIGAAVDTTAVTLSFILYHLAKFPEIQQKAFEEVHSILGEDIHQTITNQQVMQMKYLDLVIKESMRLNTTVPAFLRTLEEDVPYEKTTLPKGLMVIMIPFMMHVDPELYPNPEKFIPERFLPENLNPNRYSYAPFNLGVRNCIGKLYAMVSMKIALAKMLLNYEFVDVHHQLCLSVELTLRSKTGIRVGIRKRNYVEKNE